MKYTFEEFSVASIMHFTFNVVGSPNCPGVNGGIDVGKVPFVCGDLTVGMEIPFSCEDIELLFGECGIDNGEWNTMECGIPSCKERIFPFIRLKLVEM